jgi:hypothetical protein
MAESMVYKAFQGLSIMMKKLIKRLIKHGGALAHKDFQSK